jgi:hypothetical protein
MSLRAPAAVLGATLLLPPLATPSPLGSSLPPGLPGVAAWETIAGEVETDGTLVTYVLYVNPARQGLYQLTRYRVHQGRPARGPSYPSLETAVWNARPGSRDRLLCFERTDDGTSMDWRSLLPDSDEYQSALYGALLVYSLHGAALRARSLFGLGPLRP